MLPAFWGNIRGRAVHRAFDPAQLPDHKLRRLYNYWWSRCRNGAMPSRRDIDPLDIPDLLPNLFLLDVVGNAEDFVFRLAGSLVEDAFSMPLRGKSITEIQKAAGTPIPVAQHIEVARGGGPRYREGSVLVAGRDHLRTQRLLLPLSTDGGTVDVLMGGAIFLLGNGIRETRAEPWTYARPAGDPPLGF
ncbi:MAG: PAS domain-containing protein [Kiloniellaceae bacterium]|nr:PAS domain-containing protein [Kiloniellaceae bacterium]